MISLGGYLRNLFTFSTYILSRKAALKILVKLIFRHWTPLRHGKNSSGQPSVSVERDVRAGRRTCDSRPRRPRQQHFRWRREPQSGLQFQRII